MTCRIVINNTNYYATPASGFLTSSSRGCCTAGAAPWSCGPEERICSPGWFPVLLHVRLRVLAALAVEPLQGGITTLFLAPGSLGRGRWLLRRSALTSGWSAGTEAAITPMFCSKLDFVAK